MRRWKGHLAGLVVGAAVVLGAASLAYGSASPPALPTAASPPGTCHVAGDWLELWWTPSDTGPAVPCTQPHQTETMWLGKIDGPIAGAHRRPNPELLNKTLSSRCDDFVRVRNYLGADTPDAHWGVNMLVRVPTPAEWSHGERTFRCEALPAASSHDQPVISQPLQGVLQRTDSARFRLCRSGDSTVTCDQPHDSEAMNPWATLTGTSWPGDLPNPAMQRMVRSACGPVADRYLGAPLSSRPDLIVTADVPARQQWEGGGRGTQCWLRNASGVLTTGTVRGDLQ
jgi:hypothetical protein